DVWGVHGVGGVLGTISLGLFASKAVNPGGADGLFAGDGSFLFKQTVAVLACSAWAFAFTYVMLFLINKVTPVHVTEAEETEGLDTALHSEHAYDLDAPAGENL